MRWKRQWEENDESGSGEKPMCSYVNYMSYGVKVFVTNTYIAEL
jgi:hypothetical protein